MHEDLQLAAFAYDQNVDYSSHPNVSIGEMDKICNHCNAKKYKTETPGMCCSNGKVRLPLLEEPPEPLQSYLSGTTPESKHFLQNIRKYNSSFQMTSFDANAVNEGGFMPTFKIQGQIYHRIGSLLPVPDADAKFLQIYFMGSEEAELNQRNRIAPGTKLQITTDLQNLLHDHNELIKMFKFALEQMPTDYHKVIIKADKTPIGKHQGRFNAPTVSVVAIVMVDQHNDNRDIVIQCRNDSLQRVSETHRLYDALQYPLIFWKGDDGYHFNLLQINPLTGE